MKHVHIHAQPDHSSPVDLQSTTEACGPCDMPCGQCHGLEEVGTVFEGGLGQVVRRAHARPDFHKPVWSCGHGTHALQPQLHGQGRGLRAHQAVDKGHGGVGSRSFHHAQERFCIPRLAHMDSCRQSVCPKGVFAQPKVTQSHLPPGQRFRPPNALMQGVELRCIHRSMVEDPRTLNFRGHAHEHAGASRPRPRFPFMGAQRRLKGVVPHALSPRGETQGQQGPSERGVGVSRHASAACNDSSSWSTASIQRSSSK